MQELIKRARVRAPAALYKVTRKKKVNMCSTSAICASVTSWPRRLALVVRDIDSAKSCIGTTGKSCPGDQLLAKLEELVSGRAAARESTCDFLGRRDRHGRCRSIGSWSKAKKSFSTPRTSAMISSASRSSGWTMRR